jgi:hypothetical protein
MREQLCAVALVIWASCGRTCRLTTPMVSSPFPEGDNIHKWAGGQSLATFWTRGNGLGTQNVQIENGVSETQFPNDDPRRPPEVRFVTSIFDPNVCPDRRPAFRIFGTHWSCIYTVWTVLRCRYQRKSRRSRGEREPTGRRGRRESRERIEYPESEGNQRWVSENLNTEESPHEAPRDEAGDRNPDACESKLLRQSTGQETETPARRCLPSQVRGTPQW